MTNKTILREIHRENKSINSSCLTHKQFNN